MTSARALLIINRRSGSAGAGIDRIVEKLQTAGIASTVFSPEDPGEISRIVSQESTGVDMIIIGGGDGTFSGSLAAVMKTELPLGVLPMGTANDFARSLEIPSDLSQAIDLIARGHVRHVDVGLVNGRPFLNVASIGFSVEVAKFHRGDRKRKLRLLSYPLSWIDAFKSHRAFSVRILYDGVEITRRCVQLAVGSGRHYGGGLTIAEEAEIDDGWLHVYTVEPLTFLGWLQLLPSLKFGTFDRHSEAELLRARTVSITTKRPKPINVDGELANHTPASFSIKPRTLAVFAPNPRADPV